MNLPLSKDPRISNWLITFQNNFRKQHSEISKNHFNFYKIIEIRPPF
ncbi:hypothetical protein LEP1GSC082_4580 [Leptospira kirschneri str. H2]|nr:hypothetical protein LEP1GSC082_4580 [Leptospira kirschneri str. H2]